MNPLISVIVPVYNVEDYLDRCVESIVNQTYTNLDIILVDDGSTDSSGTKCDEWAEKDKRIKVCHTANCGQASARNKGLQVAKGDLIGFVDSDDYISLEMYDSMNKKMMEYSCDIVECTKLDFSGDEKCSVSGSGAVIVMNQCEAIKDFIKETHLKSTVWNMLVKSEIAKKVRFDDGKTHEDILWPYRVYRLSKRVVYLNKTYYFYFQRPNSTMNTKYSAKRFDGLDALESRAELVKNDYPNLYHLATRSYLGACMYQFQFLCRQPKCKEYKKYKRILYARFCSGNQVALFDGLNLKYKFWYSIFKIAPELTAKIRNTLKIGI